MYYIVFCDQQIELQSSTAFETLRIAEDLEISDLQSACEHFFIQNLNVDNAAEFLKDALSLSGGSGPGKSSHLKGATAFVDKCITFIEENAEDVIHTEGFYALPKPALIRLISSDQVCFTIETYSDCFFKIALFISTLG